MVDIYLPPRVIGPNLPPRVVCFKSDLIAPLTVSWRREPIFLRGWWDIYLPPRVVFQFVFGGKWVTPYFF